MLSASVKEKLPVTAPPTSNTTPRLKKQSPLFLWVGGCCLVSGLFNIFHAHWIHDAHVVVPQQHHERLVTRKQSIFRHPRKLGSPNGAMHAAMNDFLLGKEGLRASMSKDGDNSHSTTAGGSAVSAGTTMDASQRHNQREPQPSVGGVPGIVPPAVDGGALQKNEGKTEEKKLGELVNPETLATLSCEAYGGPDTEAAQEMVYWHDIPSDTQYKSPFMREGGVERYLTFEPDGGGWNNIRMAMETVIGLAIATGRTLVLPPSQRMYLLGKDRGKQRTDFDFDHFFPIYDMARENEGLTVITMDEFLNRTAMTGSLRNKLTGIVEFPPENRTDWNGQDVKILKEWLRNVTHTPLWSPSKCMAAFPLDRTTEAVTRLQKYMGDALVDPLEPKVLTEVPPVDSPPLYRLRENIAGRRELCIYDSEMQAEPVLHFMCYHKMKIRMLVHFYAFLFFEDYREDLWMKRFMRDHIRYQTEIQCAAARIVDALRREFGDFDSFHVRRGDFQFKRTRIEATEIYDNVKNVLSDNRTLFIATDERNKSFFDPLKEHYTVRFLDDYKHLLIGVNTNFYGMIDQLVASRGQLFFGCWHSTFTGFIARMRGYHSANHQEPGYEDGVLPTTYYYVPKTNERTMHQYSALNGAFFNREFPTSWRDIDATIGDIPETRQRIINGEAAQLIDAVEIQR